MPNRFRRKPNAEIYGNLLNCCGWATVILFFAILDQAAKSAFILISVATVLFAISLTFYGANNRFKSADPDSLDEEAANRIHRFGSRSPPSQPGKNPYTPPHVDRS